MTDTKADKSERIAKIKKEIGVACQRFDRYRTKKKDLEALMSILESELEKLGRELEVLESED